MHPNSLPFPRDTGVSSAGGTLTGPLVLPVGSAAATSLNFGTAGTGFYSSAGRPAVAVGGTAKLIVDTATISINGAVDLMLGSNTGLTAGTLTVTNSNLSRSALHRFDWTNAMVTALGAVLTGNVPVCTLPARTIVKNAYVVITGAGAGTTTLTVSLGRTGAAYIDYIVASNAQAAANTVYGDASAERGTNLTGYDLPSFTGTTVVNLQFISTVANLSAVTGSTGSVYLETVTLP